MKRKKLICPECKKMGIHTEIEVDHVPGQPYICPRLHTVISPSKDKDESAKTSPPQEKTKKRYPPGTFVLSEQPEKVRDEYLKVLKKGDQVELRRIVQERRGKEGKK